MSDKLRNHLLSRIGNFIQLWGGGLVPPDPLPDGNRVMKEEKGFITL